MAPPRRPRRTPANRGPARRTNDRQRIVFIVLALVVIAALVLSVVFAAGSGDDGDDVGSVDATTAFRVRCAGCQDRNMSDDEIRAVVEYTRTQL